MKVTTTAERLKQIMKERNLRQVDILEMCKPHIEKVGVKINKSDLSQYVNGKVKPESDKLTLLSRALNVTEPWLMGYDVDRVTGGKTSTLPDNIIPMPEMKKVPMLGTIACGKPIFAEEEHGEYVTVPGNIKADFALRAKGDSMTGARIEDGDCVFCRETEMVENGQIAAVIIGDEATLKRFYYYPDNGLVILKAENPKYDDLVYQGEAINEIRVIGKAIVFQSKVH